MADPTRRETPAPRSAPETRTDAATAAPPTRVEGTGPAKTVTASPQQEYHPERLPPRLESRFHIERLLGRGGEASVWLCGDTDTGEQAAIKLYRDAPIYSVDFDAPEYRANLDREFTVEVFTRDADHGVHYEVMEYCRLGSLEQLLVEKPGPVTDARARAILTTLARAIHGLHGGAGGPALVHGDIKPGNILARKAEPLELVLADFGLAAEMGDRSRVTNLGLGTAAYSAPELVLFKTPAADWWSLGMVLYRVLVGQHYFVRADGDTIDERVIGRALFDGDVSLAAIDDTPLSSEQQARWRLLLSGLLTRDHRERWGHDEVVAWLDGKSPEVHRPPADAGPARPRAAESFVIAGVGEFVDAEELGLAMAAHPEAAARALAGKGRLRLIEWLTTEVRTSETYSALKTHGTDWGPDELVTYFVARLAPSAPLVYAGHAVSTPADLRRLVEDWSAEHVVQALYDSELLAGLGNNEQRSGFRMIDANWHDMVGQALEIAKIRAITLDSSARGHITRHALLMAASDDTVVDGYLDRVRTRLNGSGLNAAKEVSWFADLRRDARL
ncbi:serine/threonine-protein kinase [Nocardia vaccinii]|uniref:serine/threonine-protein kinase n=1 Tax=Nocardia vaccinii TaxID=1822 RepID=UPI0008358EF9|nr:protein kinase [Nocardia vaccinii]